jgi:SM-20-related protein
MWAPSAVPPHRIDPHDVSALGDAGYFVRDAFVDVAIAEAAAAAAAAVVHTGVMRPAGLAAAPGMSTLVRSDLTTFLDEAELPPGLHPVVGALRCVQQSLRDDAWLNLPRMELQLAYYPPGSLGYARHLDAVRGTKVTGHRRITAIMYLNPLWMTDDGGELRLWLQGPQGEAATVIDVAPLLNRLLVFRSEVVEHAVLPCRRARLALTAWFSPC